MKMKKGFVFKLKDFRFEVKEVCFDKHFENIYVIKPLNHEFFTKHATTVDPNMYTVIEQKLVDMYLEKKYLVIESEPLGVKQ